MYPKDRKGKQSNTVVFNCSISKINIKYKLLMSTKDMIGFLFRVKNIFRKKGGIRRSQTLPIAFGINKV